MSDKTTLPPLLAQANRLVDDCAVGAGIDFEAFDTFLSPEDTQHWFRAWTGNPNADGSLFRVFGQDASGGYAALWTLREDADLLDQAVVFIGSEGETAVIARNLHDYLWLLAAGLGPCEAAAYPEEVRLAPPHLARFAAEHAAPPRSAHEVAADAQGELPSFQNFIESQCP